MDLFVATIAERPDLAPLLERFPPGAWPEFMRWAPYASLHYDYVVEAYAEFTLVAVDRDAPDAAVAVAYSTPFFWEGNLPEAGWDAVIRRAAHDRLLGRWGNLVSALEITIRPDIRGAGLSPVLLDALRRNAARLGYDTLVAPVRPNGKHLEPMTSMTEYAARVRDDGLPVDPWLRVHVRAGGEIVSVAPCSMTIVGTLGQWRKWTGLPCDRSGPIMVPGALTLVHCDVEADHAVYVEPNVWVRHPLVRHPLESLR
jgi:GNAT superfamily N-acetyltransferase